MQQQRRRPLLRAGAGAAVVVHELAETAATEAAVGVPGAVAADVDGRAGGWQQ